MTPAKTTYSRTALILLLIPVCSILSRRVIAEDNNLTIEREYSTNRVTLVAQLHNCSEATLTLYATLSNATSSVPLPITLDITDNTRTVITSFSRLDSSKPWSYAWNCGWKYGQRLKQAPTNFIYWLPYRSANFTVLQAARGAFTHTPGSDEEEAIDFAMPVGSPVYAARAGKVVALRADSTVGGPDPGLVKDANYVVIKHADGTYAEYLHLQTNGVLVHLGEIVTLNKPIALSGFTGYATAPHLHFEVFYNLDGNIRRSLPVMFRVAYGAVIRPEEGVAY